MNDYSLLDQILHRLVLGSSFTSELLLDLETTLFSDRNGATSNYKPVFITGLARAGTTILMRSLYDSGQFASLTYDDMPFVMAPNLWQSLTSKNKKTRVKNERAHADGIEVDFDSPEALEEVFWRTFHSREYIFSDSLKPHRFSSETLHMFETYQGLICKKYNKTRYLSKNNNHILRLKDLSRQCKSATILMPFRDPLKQSLSLLGQHKKFLNGPSFTKTYMALLAHHEFGDTHRPFAFKNQPVVGDPMTLDYWLDRWIQYYQYALDILDTNPGNIIPVSYEQLCQEPMYWKAICELVDIPFVATTNFSASSSDSYSTSASVERIESAKIIYQRLEESGIKKAKS